MIHRWDLRDGDKTLLVPEPDGGRYVLYMDYLAELAKVKAENKVSTALNIADAETIERMLAENASLKEALTKIWEVASGESQVAMDDTAGMEWISDYASSLWDDDGKFAARAGGK